MIPETRITPYLMKVVKCCRQGRLMLTATLSDPADALKGWNGDRIALCAQTV